MVVGNGAGAGPGTMDRTFFVAVMVVGSALFFPVLNILMRLAAFVYKFCEG